MLYLLGAFLNEVGVLHQSLFKLSQTVLVELLSVFRTQSLWVVHPDQEGGQYVRLLVPQPPLLLGSQALLRRWRKGFNGRRVRLLDCTELDLT